MNRRVADRYALGDQIGAGGSSRVFAAVDERLGRRVAVKMLNSRLAESADPRNRERFLREGPTSASFLHRHAVAVFDAGQDADDLYIVMELVEGPSLATVLAAQGSLPVGDATRITSQVLSALAAAHDAGVVHRDVKPSNILLAANGDAKLTDFGIAKRFDDIEESLTSTGTTIGTPGYLTPEQATGGTLSPATDVYAAGAVLFEMLTGRTVFRGDSPVAVALAQQRHPAPDVREFRADVPPALAGVVARALSQRPADRYATAAEMGSALGATWSPPPGPLPVAAIPTTVMGAPLVAGSGDTEVMPSELVVAAGTDGPPHPTPRGRSRVPIVFVGVVIAVIALLFIVLDGQDNGSPGTESSVTTANPFAITAAVTDPPASASTTTTPPATTPLVEEIIPGFPRTTELATFLSQVRNDPALVGTAGNELLTELDRLLGENSVRKQRDQAKALSSQLEKWVAADQLDPAIAQALTDLLAPLAGKAKP